MDLALCVLIAVILVCFMLLIVVSGIRFKFNLSREGFQNLPGQVQQQVQQQVPQQVQQQVPVSAQVQQGAVVSTNFPQVQQGNIHLVRNLKDTPQEERTLFYNAECKPECCSNGRGTFSCSTGCVCVTDDHLNIISSRGGNNSSPCK